MKQIFPLFKFLSVNSTSGENFGLTVALDFCRSNTCIHSYFYTLFYYSIYIMASDDSGQWIPRTTCYISGAKKLLRN